jgi:hypothetical protein
VKLIVFTRKLELIRFGWMADASAGLDIQYQRQEIDSGKEDGRMSHYREADIRWNYGLPLDVGEINASNGRPGRCFFPPLIN